MTLWFFYFYFFLMVQLQLELQPRWHRDFQITLQTRGLLRVPPSAIWTRTHYTPLMPTHPLPAEPLPAPPARPVVGALLPGSEGWDVLLLPASKWNATLKIITGFISHLRWPALNPALISVGGAVICIYLFHFCTDTKQHGAQQRSHFMAGQ